MHIFYWIESGEQKDPRLVSVDVSTCWGQSADPYSMSELRALVDNPISKVTNVITTNSNVQQPVLPSIQTMGIIQLQIFLASRQSSI
jgi:hypothetical protein